MATNDITGDKLKSKITTDEYRNNFDAIDWSVKDEPVKNEQPKPDNMYVPLRDQTFLDVCLDIPACHAQAFCFLAHRWISVIFTLI